MNLYTVQKHSHRHRKQTMVTKGEREGGGINQEEYGINMYKLLYIKQISNKDLLYSTGNYIQHHVITYNGKLSEKICITKSICCTPKTNTTLYINYASIKKSTIQYVLLNLQLYIHHCSPILEHFHYPSIIPNVQVQLIPASAPSSR